MLRRSIGRDEPPLEQYDPSSSSSLSAKPSLTTVFRVLLVVSLLCLAGRTLLNQLLGLVRVCEGQMQKCRVKLSFSLSATFLYIMHH